MVRLRARAPAIVGLCLVVWHLAIHSALAQTLDQSDSESFIRFGDASVEALRKFGDSALGAIKRKDYRADFKGIGNKYQDYQMMIRAERVMQTGRDAARAAKGSLSYAVLPTAFTIADEGAEAAGAIAGGDMPTAVGTAVSVVAEAKLVTGGATLFGMWGAAAGSFLPVVGTTIGGMIGGAVGLAAGGFTCSYAYDKYVKGLVVNGVAGLAGVFDETPLHKAMMARDEFLREQASGDLKPEWEKLRMVSASFNPEGAELVGPGSTPYIVTPKPPAPDAQQQAALPDNLANLKSFVLNQNDQIQYPLQCNVDGLKVICFGRHSQGAGMTLTITLNGTRAGNVLEMENFTVWEAATGCTSRAEYRGHDTITLEKDGRARSTGSMTARQTLRDNSCKGPLTWSGSGESNGSWRAN
ncbi:MAG: hypothetical protein JSR72_14450 [Proteobacteria bacterium]|nr:hypothetical protein [Pseudomonadota bacterium]